MGEVLELLALERLNALVLESREGDADVGIGDQQVKVLHGIVDGLSKAQAAGVGQPVRE